MSYLTKIVHMFWGEMNAEEAKKFALLSGVFFFIIGAYWMLRELKDAIFMQLVGKASLGNAKILSVLILVMLVLFYNKLVDLFEKTKLIYIIAGFYGVLYLSIAYFLTHPTIGLANQVQGTHRFLGWFIYVAIESFGSMVPPLFWAYVASVMDTTSAKKGYPLIVAGAQMGSILGSIINISLVTILGIPVMFASAAFGVLIVPFMIKLFSTKYAATSTPSIEKINEKKKPTGVIEGLKLIFSRNYLLGILVVSTVYEVVGTILDLQFKVAAQDALVGGEKVAQFMAVFGLCANGLSFLFALLGTSFLIRKLGLRIGLIIYPSVLAILVLATWSMAGSLMAFFTAMVVIKGLSYALNNPCKEIMYIPTSKDIKFKAKSWIDVQGGRSAKAIGGAFYNLAQKLGSISTYGAIVSLGIIAAWIPVAWYVGTTNSKLVQENKIVE